MALAHQLTWSHIRDLLSIKSNDARTLYVDGAAAKHLSVRELRIAIDRKAYERRAIANSKIPERAGPSHATPSVTH